jgi:hypothetical protein
MAMDALVLREVCSGACGFYAVEEDEEEEEPLQCDGPLKWHCFDAHCRTVGCVEAYREE